MYISSRSLLRGFRKLISIILTILFCDLLLRISFVLLFFLLLPFFIIYDHVVPSVILVVKSLRPIIDSFFGRFLPSLFAFALSLFPPVAIFFFTKYVLVPGSIYIFRITCLLWFHKHHLWMTYESVVTGFFPFFLIATVIQLFYRGRVWNILLFLLTVQLVGIVKATYARFLCSNAEMIFMSLYSLLYLSSLLPAKMFAIATITKSGWGTSGRRTVVVNFIGLIPVSVWVAVLLGGLAYTAYCQDLFTDTELVFLISGAILYACYWVALLTLYLAIVARRCGKPPEQDRLAFAEV